MDIFLYRSSLFFEKSFFILLLVSTGTISEMPISAHFSISHSNLLPFGIET
jgi:hypothetical protein